MGQLDIYGHDHGPNPRTITSPRTSAINPERVRDIFAAVNRGHLAMLDKTRQAVTLNDRQQITRRLPLTTRTAIQELRDRKLLVDGLAVRARQGAVARRGVLLAFTRAGRQLYDRWRHRKPTGTS
jgi:hypothetical protein